MQDKEKIKNILGELSQYKSNLNKIVQELERAGALKKAEKLRRIIFSIEGLQTTK